jgi:hypothetical protein
MTRSVLIAFRCPDCGAPQAALPSRADAASVVRCAECGREHGNLREIRSILSEQARADAARKARHIYQSRPKRKKTPLSGQSTEEGG